jgi:hypothetical protein
MLRRFSKKLDRVKSNREVAMEPMRRKLVWAERPNFQGWCCSECAWVFNPSWPVVGNSIDEMKTNFGHQRDKCFAILTAFDMLKEIAAVNVE